MLCPFCIPRAVVVLAHMQRRQQYFYMLSVHGHTHMLFRLQKKYLNILAVLQCKKERYGAEVDAEGCRLTGYVEVRKGVHV